MRIRVCFGVLVSFVLAGCTSMSDAAAPAASTRVSGTVTYLQRIALPPDAIIRVKLVDVSRADVAAVVLGEQTIEAAGRQVPFAFSIDYDPARIHPSLSYGVQARIEYGGQLRFISDQHYAVLTRGAPSHVDIVLRSVAG